MIHYISTHGVGNAWVGNELRILKKAGVAFRLHSLRPRSLKFFSSEDVKKIEQDTNVIYPLSGIYLLTSFLLAPFYFRGQFFAALANGLFSSRESFLIRLKCLGHFMVACCWARRLKTAPVDVIHSQWIHSCGTVGMYGAWLLDAPFGFTGHATDLFRDRCALRDKIKRADYIICISSFHRDFFLEQGARPEQLKIVYCGINVDLFTPKTTENTDERTFTVISSGRLVEKKGFEYLIDACKLLQGRFEFNCLIAGSGELEENLRQRIRDLQIDDTVKVTGEELLQEEITELMHGGDCYCLPCVWATDDDVDGLPQMLMEAMACGLPVISTRLVGIPDLIIDRESGLLVEPNNAEEVADAIEYLYRNRQERNDLAMKGRQLIVEKFNLETCLEPLLAEFRKRLS